MSAPTKRTSAAPCHRVLSVLRAGVNDPGDDTMKASRLLIVSLSNTMEVREVMRVAKNMDKCTFINDR